MNPKQKRRYLIAIYLIIVVSALTLLVLGFDPESHSWESVFLNLSTELFAVALVFFLVDFLFSVEDWELSDRVNVLVKHLQSKRPSAESFFQNSPDIEEYIQSASSIDLCGVTLTSTLNKRFSVLRERLFDGAQIRILIIAPNSPTLWMATWRSEDDYKIDYYQKRLDATLNDVEYLNKNWQDFQATNQASGSLLIRLMKYPPSFGILSFDKSKSNGTAFIEMYPHHTGYGAPPNFSVIQKDDPKWHNYFVEQFEAMWEAAIDWQPGMSTANISSSDLLTQKASVTNVFMKRLPALEPYFEDANEIKINGYSLERTVRENLHVFLKRLQDGASIKILLVSEEMLTTKFGDHKDTYYDQTLGLKTTLKNLHWLLQHPKNNGTIEIRFMDAEPKFNVIAMNPESEDANIFVEFYPMRWISGSRPRIELKKQGDSYWFQYFHEQFESAWAESSPFTLDQYIEDTDK